MKIFAANWKLNKNPSETRKFIKELLSKYKPVKEKSIVIFPPATSLEATGGSLPMNSVVEFGAQNCYSQAQGAFTGEISAQVVKDLGGKWILLGHSERRTLFAETDESISAKIRFVNELGLKVMLCIGESLEERKSGQTESVLKRQLEISLSGLKPQHLVVAYEPVWSIGTGLVASTEQVESAHTFIRKVLQALGLSEKTAVLYGGSVKPTNAAELLKVPGVDGFLIGGAGLEVDSFLGIVHA